MKRTGIFILVALIIGFVYYVPSIWFMGQAASFAEFAKDGVTVSVVPGSAMAGSGDPIRTPEGVGLMMGAMYEFTNPQGQKRYIDFCSGHPNYAVLFVANGGPRPVHFKALNEPIDDLHTQAAWWIRHMGSGRYLRIIP